MWGRLGGGEQLSPHIDFDDTPPDEQTADADENVADDSVVQTLPRLGTQDWVAMRFLIVSDNATAEGDFTL